ncbi:phage tail tape measure protein [Siphonobacter sp. SORGH_AS_0500]|uniref:phage tail tape measure protein n=1 Tax=Siphonobacter sp. SORGH_AS_0500 TaxID=1864824 RepID=UPI0028612736|nr:phage tail tape measure protein [Siphonobacter sp. SORGH_AS_0500]MDR6194703.1 TP901 family phage tail tape measure protein [Siphonobacter sp. SORGH_AS_0500]
MELRDKSTLDLYINGEAAISQLNKLDQEFTTLKQKQKDLADAMRAEGTDEQTIKSSEAYRELGKQIAANRKEREALRKEMDIESLSVKELTGLMRDLKKQYDSAVDPAVREELAKRIGAVKDQLDDIKLNVNKQENVWGSLKQWIIGAFTVTAAIEAGRAILSYLGDAVTAARKAEDAYADMAKSTGLSADEVKKLDTNLKSIDTRTSTEDLRAMTIVAGQLGIGLDSAGKVTAQTRTEIEGFTRGIDKATVALGDEFSGGVEEVAKEIGTVQKLFKETKDMKVEEAIEKIGSTINELGAAGSAQGPQITDFTRRVAQMGELAPKSVAETMGLGAAMIELGSSAEIAASGYKSVMGTAASSTADFAKQVGLTEKEVRNMINTDPNKFLLTLAKSFEGATPTNMAVQMGNLGIKSQEAQGFMMMLATKTEFVAQKQLLANDAFKAGTSLQDEFNKKNENAAAQYEKLQKQLGNIQEEIGQALLPSVGKLISGFSDLINWFKSATTEGQPLSVVFKSLGDVGKILWQIITGVWDVFVDLISIFKPLTGGMDGTTLVIKLLATALLTIVSTTKAVYSAILVIIDGFKVLITAVESAYGVLKGDISVTQGINNIMGAVGSLTSHAKTNFGSIATDFKKIWADSAAESQKATSAVNAHGKAAADNAKAQTALTKVEQAAQTANHLEELKKRGDNETTSDVKILSEKEQRAINTQNARERREDARRDREEKKEQEKDEKIAAEAIKNHQETQAKIDLANIKQIEDEKTRKIVQLGWEYEQSWIKNQKEIKDKEQFLEWEKTAQAQLNSDIARVNAEMNEKKRKEDEATLKKQKENAEELARTEFATSKSIIERQLLDKNLSVDQRKQLEMSLQNLQTNYELEQLRIRHEAAVAKANQSGQDTTALTAKYNAEKELLEAQSQAKKKDIEAQNLEQRKQNQQAFFSAIKGLMDGDFSGFMDILNKKFANEKAKNNAELQQFNAKTQEIGAMAVQGMQLLQGLNQKFLESQLAKIAKEKDAQLKSWEAQYKSGKIDKQTYEKEVARINDEAREKEKEAKLKAWKREQALNIAMAIVNGAMAALKSLATMGFPLGLIGVAGAAIATGIQIGIIKAQKPPEFKEGGILRKIYEKGGKYIRNGGVPEGPRHGSRYGESGISLVRRDTGQEVGEMEGDEPIMILSRNTYRNNRPVIDKLLDSSLHKNGAPIYEKGGWMGSDGGDYRDYLEKPQFGQQYLFGSKRRKAERAAREAEAQANAAAAEAQEEADAALAEAQSAANSAGAAGGEAYDDAVASSQATMDNVDSNTGETVDLLKQVNEKLSEMASRQSSQSDVIIGSLNGIINKIGESNSALWSINSKPSVSSREISDAINRSSATASQSTFG